MTIGEKIKALRKEKGFTQSSLADGIVTRNMLSLIESGAAKPSLGTLKKISERLGVSTEYFLSEENETENAPSEASTSSSENSDMESARLLYTSGDFAACLDAVSALDYEDNETALVKMRCALSLGEENFKKRSVGAALKYFTLAARNAEKTIYATHDELLKIRRMYQLADAIVSNKNFSDMPRVSFGENDEAAAYVAAYYGIDIGDFDLLLEHRNHMAILRLIKFGRFADAERALLDQLKITSDKLTRYYMFRSLEECFRKTGDFKGTFEAAAQRRAAYEKLVKE